MTALAWTLIGGAVALPAYAYVGYPVLLRLLSAARAPRTVQPPPDKWPSISITVPAYNEEAQIRGLIESLLALDYPADKRQILIVSDASTDGTDAVVAEYEDQGVELLRMPQRGGKDAAEAAAATRLHGDIVVNTDASIRIRADALKPLIARFADPSVGLASGRDLSIGQQQDEANAGEGGYVGYEMWVRALETQLAGIVGASGCLYAIRSQLHRENQLPAGLSRDFGSALFTREQGYTAVSVDEAVCFVPRGSSLRREYRRKVRTMARGLRTLFHKRALLNPLRHGVFSWMLFSHKLCRWLVPWGFAAGTAGLALLSTSHAWPRWALAAALAAALPAVIAWRLPDKRSLPRPLALPAFAVLSNLAALHAWIRALSRRDQAVWEPTRRDAVKIG